MKAIKKFLIEYLNVFKTIHTKNLEGVFKLMALLGGAIMGSDVLIWSHVMTNVHHDDFVTIVLSASTLIGAISIWFKRLTQNQIEIYLYHFQLIMVIASILSLILGGYIATFLVTQIGFGIYIMMYNHATSYYMDKMKNEINMQVYNADLNILRTVSGVMSMVIGVMLNNINSPILVTNVTNIAYVLLSLYILKRMKEI